MTPCMFFVSIPLLSNLKTMARSNRSPLLIGLLVVIVILGFWLFSSYNGLVTGSEQLANSWNQVETQYQRRFDLIPNLVNTVKGEANFEQSTLTAVTEARTNWLSAQQSGDVNAQVQATNQTETALARLLVSVEAYPTLKATQGFEDFMVQLEGTENRIATARKDYNDSVLSYNLIVKRFPGNIAAMLFGFEPAIGFQADAGSQNAPSVNFQ